MNLITINFLILNYLLVIISDKCMKEAHPKGLTSFKIFMAFFTTAVQSEDAERYKKSYCKSHIVMTLKNLI